MKQSISKEKNCWIVVIILVGGDWNHGILNGFPIILGMSSSQVTIFQRGRSTTNQYSMSISGTNSWMLMDFVPRWSSRVTQSPNSSTRIGHSKCMWIVKNFSKWEPSNTFRFFWMCTDIYHYIYLEKLLPSFFWVAKKNLGFLKKQVSEFGP